jgi:hypothetical protein
MEFRAGRHQSYLSWKTVDATDPGFGHGAHALLYRIAEREAAVYLRNVSFLVTTSRPTSNRQK